MPFTQTQLQEFMAAMAVDYGRLGLVVTDRAPAALQLPDIEGGAASMNVDIDADSEKILSLLYDCAKRGRWGRLNLVDGTLPGRVYNQLRNISTMGHLFLIQRGLEANKEQEIRWPAEAGLVIVVSRESLDKIKIPTFLNLFGPVLRES